MTHRPHFSLHDFEIDTELVRQLPRKLAYYHLVLPLSAEGSELSLAMAEPDNQPLIETLQDLLRAAIVPVQSDADEIRAVLDRVWKYVPTPAPQLLTWSETPEHARHTAQVAQSLQSSFPARILDLQHEDMDSMLRYTRNDSSLLAVIGVTDAQDSETLIRQTASPLLLMLGRQGRFAPESYFRRIMLALRGHAPDLSALDWVIPLVHGYGGTLSLLAVTAPPRRIGSGAMRVQHSLAAFLDPAREPSQHLSDCTRRLTGAGIRGYLKLCQGDPFQQIKTEFIGGQYSLLVLVSEARGDFVSGVLDTIRDHASPHAVLIVKPTLGIPDLFANRR
jgi:hypothetical protein